MEKEWNTNYKRIYGTIGNSIGFFFNEYNSPWFTIGPDWPFFLCTWMMIAVISIFVTIFFTADKPLLNAIGQAVILLCLGSYSMTALINPGIEVKPLHLEEDP